MLCKLVPMMAGTNVFVSTITITAIALDRFHLIVHPTEKDLLTVRPGATALAISAIWILSVLMSAPLLVFCTTQSVAPIPGLQYDVCVENPQLHYVKASYSIASALCQYLVPILIVSVAHAQICSKLRARMNSNRPTVPAPAPSTSGNSPPSRGVTSSTANSSAMAVPTSPSPTLTPAATVVSPPLLAPPNGRRKSESTSTASDVSSLGGATSAPSTFAFQARKRRKEASRKRKTNRLLVAIAVVFAGSWLPLNAYNIIADFDQAWLMSLVDANRSAVVIAVCHLLVLCSACTNPVLYGWLNENFRREFIAVLCPSRLAAAAGTTSIRCCSCCNCNRCPAAGAAASSPSTHSAGNDVIMIVVRGDAASGCRSPTTSRDASTKFRTPRRDEGNSVDDYHGRRHRKDCINGRVGSVERHRQRQQTRTASSCRHGNDSRLPSCDAVPPSPSVVCKKPHCTEL